jgi:5'-nucleotidase
MRILVTNDDGIEAPGLRALTAQLAREHTVLVSAPDRQRSSASHWVTYFHSDLHAAAFPVPGAAQAWGWDGTPADSTYAGLCALWPGKIDLVVSGINFGDNYASDVLYSGTVGAAMEGLVLGVPAAAISLAGVRQGHYEELAAAVLPLLDKYVQDPMASHYMLNINALDRSSWRGVKWTRMDGRRPYKRPPHLTAEGQGRLKLARMTAPIPAGTMENYPDGDIAAVHAGYISLSTLNIDLTDFEARAFWQEGL